MSYLASPARDLVPWGELEMGVTSLVPWDELEMGVTSLFAAATS